MKYKCINGWTKQGMIRAIIGGNKGRLSINNHICLYRSDGDNKCAVGVFIPDDLYSSICECTTAVTLLAKFPGLTTYMPLSFKGMDELQQVHDGLIIEGSSTDPRPYIIKWIENNVRE